MARAMFHVKHAPRTTARAPRAKFHAPRTTFQGESEGDRGPGFSMPQLTDRSVSFFACLGRETRVLPGFCGAVKR
jgi:hypothetical protein